MPFATGVDAILKSFCLFWAAICQAGMAALLLPPRAVDAGRDVADAVLEDEGMLNEGTLPAPFMPVGLALLPGAVSVVGVLVEDGCVETEEMLAG